MFRRHANPPLVTAHVVESGVAYLSEGMLCLQMIISSGSTTAVKLVLNAAVSVLALELEIECTLSVLTF